MADPPPGQMGPSRHLDASGPREVVYCHQCYNEWYKEQSDLTCPRCHSGATEIVSSGSQGPSGKRWIRIGTNFSMQISPENDPRERDTSPDPLEEFRQLHNHSPWLDDDVPNPNEGDVEEYITHGPGGRTFFSHTFTTRGPRGPPGDRNRRPPLDHDDTANVLRDFQTMINGFVVPNFRQGRAGRSGHDALSPRDEPFRRTHFGRQVIGSGIDGPQIGLRSFTITTGGRLPRDPEALDPHAEDIATYASPDSPRSASGPSFLVISIRARPDQLASIVGRLLNVIGPPRPDGEPNGPPGGMPLGLQGLLSLLNPTHPIGDAVYSQEALDRIISALMEQHPQSNAPGPASDEAIASLPKKDLDEKMLGPELKAECSVCMDDVTVGDEVVVLPCTHWFHEACATAWLKEHNTCPICRTGIGGEQAPPLPRRASQGGQSPTPEDDSRARRGTFRRSPTNEARLNAIRDRGRLSPTPESGTLRYQIVGDSIRSFNRSPSPPEMPGSFSSRSRDSEISENQRESRYNTSGSDRSHRSSNSGNTGESSSSGGLFQRLRRFGSSRRQE